MNCYNKPISRFDLVVAEDSEFNLTANRVYAVLDCVGPNLIEVKNDLNKVETYATEYFRFYEGETIWQ